MNSELLIFHQSEHVLLCLHLKDLLLRLHLWTLLLDLQLCLTQIFDRLQQLQRLLYAHRQPLKLEVNRDLLESIFFSLVLLSCLQRGLQQMILNLTRIGMTDFIYQPVLRLIEDSLHLQFPQAYWCKVFDLTSHSSF